MTKLISFIILSIFVINIAHADLPVPRWVSLKGDANLRKGPTEDATIIYRYQLKGYPMEILRDIDGWRYVRDPLDGVEGWMAQQLFSGKRYAITAKSPFSYGYDSPRKDKIVVKLSPKVHAKINECDSSWCELIIESNGSKTIAWVEKIDLLGVYNHEIIN
jgi:SH3-like domain-containing protein|tara:strand:- start:1647 stop:2129 length:483 start_codon:yes stop_codon:yes gene_type:complete